MSLLSFSLPTCFLPFLQRTLLQLSLFSPVVFILFSLCSHSALPAVSTSLIGVKRKDPPVDHHEVAGKTSVDLGKVSAIQGKVSGDQGKVSVSQGKVSVSQDKVSVSQDKIGDHSMDVDGVEAGDDSDDEQDTEWASIQVTLRWLGYIYRKRTW